MFKNILKTRKTYRGSWAGQAPYQAAPVHGKEWAFSVQLENQSTAYILSDVNDLPSQYRCATPSSRNLSLLPGTQVKVDVVSWSNLQVIVKLEPVATEDLRTCSTCEKLGHYQQNSFDTNQAIFYFSQKLKGMVSNSEVSEFEPEDQHLLRTKVNLSQFLPGQPLPVSEFYEARVFILCHECQAEWVLGYNFERSTPRWSKYREGFRFS